MKRKIIILILIAIVSIQFIRPSPNNGTLNYPTDISIVYQTPSDITILLREACYDCHSNRTVYPWYANIQPVYWWLNHHIVEGKAELNFSEFGTYTLQRQKKKFIEIAREVTEEKMPLNTYTWTHPDAKLAKVDAQKIIQWANLMAKQLDEKIIQQEK